MNHVWLGRPPEDYTPEEQRALIKTVSEMVERGEMSTEELVQLRDALKRVFDDLDR